MTLQTDIWMDGRTDGRPGGYNNIPTFSSKSAGINKWIPVLSRAIAIPF